MLKQAVRDVVLFLSLITCVVSVSAQSRHRFTVHVPFQFVLNGQTLTAGEYVIERTDPAKRASVHTVDGQQVIRRTGLIARPNEKGKLVTVIFDSSLLQRQDHIATLRGRMKNERSETIAEYYFRVQLTPRESNPTPPKE